MSHWKCLEQWKTYLPVSSYVLFLSKLFISARKQNGTEYGQGTLSGFQRNFKRYLHENGSLINIFKDYEFSKSWEVLAAKRESLVQRGKGKCAKATRELTAAEEDALFENGQFGVLDPRSLQSLQSETSSWSVVNFKKTPTRRGTRPQFVWGNPSFTQL